MGEFLYPHAKPDLPFSSPCLPACLMLTVGFLNLTLPWDIPYSSAWLIIVLPQVVILQTYFGSVCHYLPHLLHCNLLLCVLQGLMAAPPALVPWNITSFLLLLLFFYLQCAPVLSPSSCVILPACLKPGFPDQRFLPLQFCLVPCTINIVIGTYHCLEPSKTATIILP